MYRRVVLMAVFLLLLSLTSANAQNVWVAKDGAVKNSEAKAAIFNSDALYIATRSALYKARDLKERWEPVFSLPQGGSNEINCIAGRSKIIFLGTKRGLFKSEDYGVRWRNVFRTILPDKNNITCIELSNHSRNRIMIGTRKGIFLSDDLGGKWLDTSAGLKDAPVLCLAMNKELVYAGTESGLYVMRPGVEGWRRVFVQSAGEKNEAEETEERNYEESEKYASIRSIAINDNRVYVTFDKDILYSDDGAKSWNNFPCAGLKGVINYLLISVKNKSIFCATDKGVFEFINEKSLWLELYKGMAKSPNVHRAIFGSEDEKTLLAVTDKGMYSFEAGDYLMDKYPDIGMSLKTLKIAFDGEPTFEELQRAAIKFCDVSPEKIRNWQRDSRIKAIVPKLSFGMANHRSSNTEIYTSATKEYVTVGPDDTYNAFDVSVSWDLGNLIWSDDQTNIDVRSRLMVQLRNDILDDLRRAYYERKRLQFELMTNPPKDMSAKFEKELRLGELTQAIDDLAGNYLSEHIRKVEAK